MYRIALIGLSVSEWVSDTPRPMKGNNLLRMTARRRAIAVTAMLGLGAALPSGGSVIDRPAIKIEGVVIVWAADSASVTPIASDFIIEDGGASTDLIAGDVYTVLTGTLDALDETYPLNAGATLRIRRIAGGPNQDTAANGDRLTDATDTFTAFRLRAATDVRTIRSEIESSFYVASNKAFSIDVTSSAVGDPADLNLIRLRMRMTRTGSDDGLSFGSAAQFPHTGNTSASGVRWGGFRRLSTMTTGRNIYNGDRRTALLTGSIAAQSVRFDQTYRWNTGNIDLSAGVFDVEAIAEYVVYIP